MESKTSQFLLTAQRNRVFAESALAHPEPMVALREWAAVGAFYSVVHYVNAYLYEQQRFEPANHAQRYAALMRTTELRIFRRSYQRLNDTGYRVRYDVMHPVSNTWLRELVEVHLRRIGDEITSLLTTDV